MADDVRLYMFDGGTLKCHVENIKMNQGLGDPFEIPVPWYLLTHPKGNVVIDGGNAAECATDPVGHWGGTTEVYYPEMTPEQACVPALKAAGFDPGRREVHPAVAPAPRSHGRARGARRLPQRARDRHPGRVRVRARARLVRGGRVHPGGLQQAGRPVGPPRADR
jgi:hypothetical protein